MAMKRTPRRAAAAISFSASARLYNLSSRRPPRRARSGRASSAAPAPPYWLIRARKVRGPTFSERMRRSQSRRCSSVRIMGLSLLPDLALGAGKEAADVLAVLPPQQRHENDGHTGHAGLAEEPQDNRRRGAGNQGGERGILGGESDPEPDQAEDQRRQGLEADQDADEGGDALAALELEPDREEVAEEGAEGRHRREFRSPLGGDQHRDRALERIGKQGCRRQAFPPCPQDVGGADIAGPDLADIA